MFSLFNRDLIKCNSTLSTGQREVLPDLWSLHDSYVQGRSNRNGALLHRGDLCLCLCHGRRWDSKSPPFIYVLPIFFTFIVIVLLNYLSYFTSIPFVFLSTERRASQVAQAGGRKTPKLVPFGNDRTGHRSPPFLPLCGFQIPRRGFTLPEGGMSFFSQVLCVTGTRIMPIIALINFFIHRKKLRANDQYNNVS